MKRKELENIITEEIEQLIQEGILSKLFGKKAKRKAKKRIRRGLKPRPSGKTLTSKDMTDKMHEMWLANYRKTNGSTPRLKPIPGADPGDIKKYSGVKEVDGQLVQDINQAADKIHPNLAQKLNGAPATDYAKSINARSLNSPADADILADDFHNVWMKHNGWQRDSAPQLFKPYAQLTSDEKIKDLQQVLVATTLKYGQNSPQVKIINNSIAKLQ